MSVRSAFLWLRGFLSPRLHCFVLSISISRTFLTVECKERCASWTPQTALFLSYLWGTEDVYIERNGEKNKLKGIKTTFMFLCVFVCVCLIYIWGGLFSLINQRKSVAIFSR